MVDDIRVWDEIGYKFVKRQSQRDPNVWVSINLRGDAGLTSGKRQKAVN